MRTMMMFWLGLVFHCACAQIFVLAGCETEQQVKVAEQLMDQARHERWQSEKWRTECRRQGFEVVGSENVFYLVPIYHTPSMVEHILIPLFEQVSRATSPLLRWDDFTESTRSALMSLLSRPSAVRYFAAEPSAASFRTKFQRGEIAVGIGDLWKFQAVDIQGDEPLRIFGESKRFRLPPDRVLTTLSEPLKPKDGHEDNLPIPSTRWSFVFSHEVPLDQQIAHIEAYLHWLKTLQRSVAAQTPAIAEQLWKIFYPDKPYPNLAATYSLEELQSIVGADVLLRVPPAEQARYAQERYRFTGWEVGLELIKRTPDGNGVARYFVPLEVLLGLRPY